MSTSSRGLLPRPHRSERVLALLLPTVQRRVPTARCRRLPWAAVLAGWWAGLLDDLLQAGGFFWRPSTLRAHGRWGGRVLAHLRWTSVQALR